MAGGTFRVHYCPACQKQRAAYAQCKRDHAVANGKCRRCFKRATLAGKPECAFCLARSKVLYFARSKRRRRYKCANASEFVQRRMVQGLCVRCGCDKSDRRKLFCRLCNDIERHMASSQRSRVRKQRARATTVVDGFQYLYGDRQDTAGCRPSHQELAEINHAYDHEN